MHTCILFQCLEFWSNIAFIVLQRLFVPKTPYRYHGIFMTFDAYNVEYRDRVKCVSGIEGTVCYRCVFINGFKALVLP